MLDLYVYELSILDCMNFAVPLNVSKIIFDLLMGLCFTQQVDVA